MRIRKKATLVPAAAVALAMALTACSGGDDEAASFADCADEPVTCNSGERAEGGEITWAIDSAWEGWNYWRADARTVYLYQAISATFPTTGLFSPDPSGEDFKYNDAVFDGPPELVEDDPQSWQWKLREGASWSDGEPISVDDFIWHWYHLSNDPDKCAVDEDLNCAPASDVYGSSVKAIEEVEPGTVQITFKDGRFNPEWQYTEVMSYPAHIAEAEGFDWKNDPKDMAASSVWFNENAPPVSAGPYVVDDAKLGDYVTLTPNEKWLGEEKPTLDKITLTVIDDVEQILTSIENEEIDGASPANIDPDTWERAKGIDGVETGMSKGPSWTHIDMNTQNEFLSDVELRRAIFTAINSKQIIDRTFGRVQEDLPFELETKTNHLFQSDSPYHEDHVSDSGQGSGDVDAAKKILEDAGYTWKDEVLHTPDGEKVDISFRAAEDDVIRADTADIVQAQLEELGIDLGLNGIPSGDLGKVLGEGEFDMIVFGWSGDPAFSGYPQQQWHSSSASNFGKLESDELDEAVEAVRATPDLDEAAARSNEAMSLLVDEAYVLPIVDTPVMIFAREGLVNIRDNWASSLRAMYNMNEWGIEAGGPLDE
ncbi:MAG: ABC transporter family substrate-binding protein [Stackebrandtia sp.]